eukprot:3213100-Rhodomonas_salina.1
MERFVRSSFRCGAGRWARLPRPKKDERCTRLWTSFRWKTCEVMACHFISARLSRWLCREHGWLTRSVAAAAVARCWEQGMADTNKQRRVLSDEAICTASHACHELVTVFRSMSETCESIMDLIEAEKQAELELQSHLERQLMQVAEFTDHLAKETALGSRLNSVPAIQTVESFLQDLRSESSAKLFAADEPEFVGDQALEAYAEIDSIYAARARVTSSPTVIARQLQRYLLQVADVEEMYQRLQTVFAEAAGVEVDSGQPIVLDKQGLQRMFALLGWDHLPSTELAQVYRQARRCEVNRNVGCSSDVSLHACLAGSFRFRQLVLGNHGNLRVQ